MLTDPIGNTMYWYLSWNRSEFCQNCLRLIYIFKIMMPLVTGTLSYHTNFIWACRTFELVPQINGIWTWLSIWLHISWVPFYQHGLTIIPAWVNNYIHYKVWDELTYPFPNLNGTTVEVWEWISNFIPHFTGYVRLKLIHVGIRGPCERSRSNYIAVCRVRPDFVKPFWIFVILNTFSMLKCH